MGRACSIHRKNEKYTQKFIEAWQIDSWLEPDVDGKVILNFDLNKQETKTWNWLM